MDHLNGGTEHRVERRTATVFVATAITLAAGLLAPSAGASARSAVARLEKMDYGVMPGWEFQTGRMNDDTRSYPCTAQVMGWARENGKSGVQRIRIHYEVYAPYAAFWMPSERTTNQVAYPKQEGGQFPDDERSYWLKALLPWGYLIEEQGDQLVMDYVGERPSFWMPDLHEEVLIGTYDCDSAPPVQCTSSGPLSCPTDVRPIEEAGDEVTGEGGARGVKDQDQDGVQDCPDGSFAPINPDTGLRDLCRSRGGR